MAILVPGNKCKIASAITWAQLCLIICNFSSTAIIKLLKIQPNSPKCIVFLSNYYNEKEYYSKDKEIV